MVSPGSGAPDDLVSITGTDFGLPKLPAGAGDDCGTVFKVDI
jgi:hypothetical protein